MNIFSYKASLYMYRKHLIIPITNHRRIIMNMNNRINTNVKKAEPLNRIDGYKKLLKKIEEMNQLNHIVVAISLTFLLISNSANVFAVTITEAIDITKYAENTQSMSVDARSAILIEPQTGKILFEYNSNEQYAPASVTKVMTLLLIYEAIANKQISWEDSVTVSQHAASMGGSQIFLEAMEVQPVRDLVKSIAIASANDAAVAMAEFISGSEESFVALMNEKASELGMENTNFVNACGLDDPQHLTSANDIALMSRELITKYPEIFEFTNIWQDSITHKTARGETEFILTNTNRLIKNYPGATGLKTGSTSTALYCLSGTAKRDNLELIAVIMGASDPTARFSETMKVLDYGFANFDIIASNEVGVEVANVSIHKGEQESVGVVVEKQISTLVKKGETSPLTSEIEMVNSLNAPVEVGTKAGEIIYYYNDEEVGRSNLVTVERIEKATFTHMVNRLLIKWFE